MSVFSTILDVIKRQFVSGILIVVPLILTFIVLRFLFETVDGVLRPTLHNVLGYYWAGLGLLTTLLVILLAGFLTRNFIGHRIYKMGDQILVRVPLIRPIYSASKQLLEGMTGAGGSSFKEMALIQYPRPGLYSLCFVTRRLAIDLNGTSREFAACFVPSTPTPVSGMTVLVPADEVVPVNLSVEEGVKFFVSGGAASPESIRKPAPPAVTSSEDGIG
jgi:uncharacterized membrane protein